MNRMSENHEKLQKIDGLTIYDIICLAAQLALKVIFQFPHVYQRLQM